MDLMDELLDSEENFDELTDGNGDKAKGKYNYFNWKCIKKYYNLKIAKNKRKHLYNDNAQ